MHDAPPLTEWESLVLDVSAALADGLEYHGHELDDVTGSVHALTPEAKKYERGMEAFGEICAKVGKLLGRLERLEADLKLEEVFSSVRIMGKTDAQLVGDVLDEFGRQP